MSTEEPSRGIPRFDPGQPVALREVWRDRIWTARPAHVVRDEDDLLMFSVGPPMRWMCPREPGGGAWLRVPTERWELRECIWGDTHALSFAWPGRPHAVLFMWDATWTPRSWYVNLQEPLRRTMVGFHYLDLELDALVALDRSSWRWKDEDELVEALRRGVHQGVDPDVLRAQGEELVHMLLDGRAPFDRDWTRWRPDPSWGVPELPPGWDRV